VYDANVLPNGHHGLSCQFSKGRASRFKIGNELIRKSLVAAGILSSLESVGLDPNPKNRPVLMEFISSNGKIGRLPHGILLGDSACA
jgi:hypothetical protein